MHGPPGFASISQLEMAIVSERVFFGLSCDPNSKDDLSGQYGSDNKDATNEHEAVSMLS